MLWRPRTRTILEKSSGVPNSFRLSFQSLISPYFFRIWLIRSQRVPTIFGSLTRVLSWSLAGEISSEFTLSLKMLQKGILYLFQAWKSYTIFPRHELYSVWRTPLWKITVSSGNEGYKTSLECALFMPAPPISCCSLCIQKLPAKLCILILCHKKNNSVAQ